MFSQHNEGNHSSNTSNGSNQNVTVELLQRHTREKNEKNEKNCIKHSMSTAKFTGNLHAKRDKEAQKREKFHRDENLFKAFSIDYVHAARINYLKITFNYDFFFFFSFRNFHFKLFCENVPHTGCSFSMSPVHKQTNEQINN